MKKILHLIPDNIFADSAIAQFSLFADLNDSKFVCIQKDERLKHITSKNVEVISPEQLLYSGREASLCRSGYGLVVIHSLSGIHARLINRLNFGDLNLLWIGMGFDYYHFTKIELLLPKTHHLKRQVEGRIITKRGLYRVLRGLSRKLVARTKDSYNALSAVGSFKYFAPVLPAEHDFIVENSDKEVSDTFSRLRTAKWRYGKNGKFVEENNDLVCDRKCRKLILGNSASFPNNHYEALVALNEVISFSKLSWRVFAPLNYGVSRYGDLIASIGKQFFRDYFIPMRDFIPYEEYVEFLRGCSVMIMNHRRQQAAGNVGLMLFFGGTVFLREENPLYLHWKEKGAVIFSVQQLKQNHSLLEYRLGDSEISWNKSLVVDDGGWSSCIDKTRTLLNQCVQ